MKDAKVQVKDSWREARIADGARIKGLRLLVVDDVPERAQAFVSVLCQLGANALMGDRGDGGYAQAVKLMPDAIISDLATPGERGWGLVQKLRRNPVLRWAPVLLLRWWKDPQGGRGSILLEQVIDRLEEALAPLRVIEERISANAPLSERVDLIGPFAVLRLLSRGRVSGLMTVNDAWSVFEVHLDKGELHSVVRRGLGGSVEVGHEAFIQLMLCDAGRWSYRDCTITGVPSNIFGDLESAVTQAEHLLGTIFGSPRDLEKNLIIKIGLLSELTVTMSASANHVAQAVKGGLSGAKLGELFAHEDPLEVERVLQALIRCGAIRPQLDTVPRPTNPAERRAAHSVAEILMAIGEEYSIQDEPREPAFVPDTLWSSTSKVLDGYMVTKVKSEKVSLIPASPEGNTMPVTMNELSELLEDDTAIQDLTNSHISEHFGMVDQAPNDGMEDNGLDGTHKQKWLAIILAGMVGLILILGLAYVASGSRGEGKNEPKQEEDSGNQIQETD